MKPRDLFKRKTRVRVIPAGKRWRVRNVETGQWLRSPYYPGPVWGGEAWNTIGFETKERAIEYAESRGFEVVDADH